MKVFNTVMSHIAITYYNMEEERAVFEQLTLRDFKKWSSTVLTAHSHI